MKKNFRLWAIFLALLTAQVSYAGEKIRITGGTGDLIQKIRSMADVQVKKIDFEISFTQPVDHQNPEAGTFEQRVYLTHRDFSKPVVLWLEGYASRGSQIHEPTQFLGANQLVIEHRFFGESLPDTLDWERLTIKQAAADHHRIVSAFKPLYPGKWISSGRSKGGQTAMYHRRFYPDDVDATICYVAPLNFSDEEPRIYTFLATIGDEDCRTKVINFQKLLLKKKQELMPHFLRFADKNDHTFTKLGPDAAYEYTALEYSFSFWQWHRRDCLGIPDNNDPPEEITDHWLEISSPYYFADRGIAYLIPSYYQMLTELGYYGYDTKPFEGLLSALEDPDFTFNLPEGVDIEFNPAVMKDINEWINEHGNNMIFIYGELDTWSASAVRLKGKTNALKMVKEGGDHRTYIRSFSPADQERIFSTLEDWLQIKIDR